MNAREPKTGADSETLRDIARRAFIGRPVLNINSLDEHRTERLDHIQYETTENGLVIEVYEPNKQSGL